MTENEIQNHLEGLAKELSCSICLSVMDTPVSRLPCCHYFCQECITESVRHAAKCPVCKSKATRRDIAHDPTMDRVVHAFKGLQEHQRDLEAAAAAVHLNEVPAGDDGGPAIPWLQGVEDDAFRSPSRSLSGTALEKLRAKRDRSASPSVHRSGRAPAAAISDGTAPAAAEKEVPPRRKSEPAKAVASRKRSEPAQEQKEQPAANKKQRKKVAAAAAAAEDEHIRDDKDMEEMSPEMSLPAGICAAEAAKNLDSLIAGLESVEPTPGSQAAEPPPAAAAAAGGKENKRSSGAAAAVNRKSSGSHQENAGSTAGKKRKSSASTAADAAALEEQEGGRRRIPTRLLPWSCGICTFENKGGDAKCQICSTLRGADTPAAEAIAAADAAVAVEAAAVDPAVKEEKHGSSEKKKKDRRGSGPQQQQQQQQTKLTSRKQQRRRSKDAAAREAALVEEQHPKDKKQKKDCSWTGGKTGWVLLGSGLDTAGRQQLRDFAAAAGATVVTGNWSDKVTHVVCGAGGAGPNQNAARRTFKYLMGVLHGRWVLTLDWVKACISAKKAVPEEKYQVEVDGNGCPCGVAASRAAHGSGLSGGVPAAQLLLKGFEIQLQGDFASRAQMTELLKAAGAKVLTRLPTAGPSGSHSSNRGGGVVLVEVPDISEAATAGFKAAVMAEPWFAKAVESGVPVASQRWVTDSIARFSLCPLDEFLIS